MSEDYETIESKLQWFEVQNRHLVSLLERCREIVRSEFDSQSRVSTEAPRYHWLSELLAELETAVGETQK